MENKIDFQKDIIIFDVETSSNNVLTASMIQLGAYKFSRYGKLTEDSFSVYIKPYTDDWTEDAYKCHKISKDYLNTHGLIIDQALKEFETWVGDKSLFNMGQWSNSYDVAILFNAYGHLQSKYPFNRRAWDIASIVRYELIKKGIKPNLKKYGVGLQSCCKQLGIKVNKENLHDARYDAYLTGKALEKIIQD